MINFNNVINKLELGKASFSCLAYCNLSQCKGLCKVMNVWPNPQSCCFTFPTYFFFLIFKCLCQLITLIPESNCVKTFDVYPQDLIILVQLITSRKLKLTGSEAQLVHKLTCLNLLREAFLRTTTVIVR